MYNDNFIYVGDNGGAVNMTASIKSIVAYSKARFDISSRILVSYDESDNITWENCKVTDNTLIDNLINMQPACWQQYIDRDGKYFTIFAFPLK